MERELPLNKSSGVNAAQQKRRELSQSAQNYAPAGSGRLQSGEGLQVQNGSYLGENTIFSSHPQFSGDLAGGQRSVSTTETLSPVDSALFSSLESFLASLAPHASLDGQLQDNNSERVKNSQQGAQVRMRLDNQAVHRDVMSAQEGDGAPGVAIFLSGGGSLMQGESVRLDDSGLVAVQGEEGVGKQENE